MEVPSVTLRAPSARAAASSAARAAPTDDERGSLVAALWGWLICPTVILLSNVPVANLASRVVLISFMLWFAWVVVLGGRQVRYSAPLAVFLAWGGIALAISLLSTNPELAVRKWVTIFGIGVVSIAVFHAVLWARSIRSWGTAFAVSALLAYLSNYLPIESYVVADYQTDVGGRFVGTLANANAFGRAMVFGFFITLMLLIQKPGGRFAVAKILAMGLFGLAVFESGSRTSIIGLTIGVVAFYSCIQPRYIFAPKNFLALSVVTSGFFIAFYHFPERFSGVMDRVHNLLHFLGLRQEAATTETSLDNRLELVKTAFRTWMENPLGIGLDNYRVVAGTYAHSNFMEVLVSTGALGLLVYYLGFASFARHIRTLSHLYYRRYFVGCLAVIVAVELFSVSYYSKTYWLFVALLSAAATLLLSVQAADPDAGEAAVR